MFNVQCYLDGKRIGGFLYQHVPRVGDTMRFDGERYGKVMEVIWCMDEPTVDGQRVNLRVEAFRNDGGSEAQHVADSENLNCPTCGGSGHVGDTTPSDALRRALAEYPSKNTHQMQSRKVCAGVLALAESYGADPKLAIHPRATLSGKSVTKVIVDDHYTPKQPIRFLCYGCHEYVTWLAPDSRCSSCTRLSPDEV